MYNFPCKQNNTSMYPQKHFHASEFSYLLCYNPIHKIKIETRSGWETINSKPPKPIIMNGQLETMNNS